MKLSARNVLKGRVVKVIRGATTAHVKIEWGEFARRAHVRRSTVYGLLASSRRRATSW